MKYLPYPIVLWIMLFGIVRAETLRVAIPKLNSHRPVMLERLFYPIVKEMALSEGWVLETFYISMDSIAVSLKSGRCDLALGVPAGSEVRDTDLLYNREFIFSTWAQVYDNEKKAIRSYRDLNDRWLGFVQGSPYVEAFDAFALPLDLKYRKTILKSEEAVVHALLSGWIDVAVFDRLHERELLKKFPIYKTPIIFAPIELKIAVASCHAARIENIDYHLREMKRDFDSVYLQTSRSLFYSPQENWLRSHVRLIFAVLGGTLGILAVFNLFLRLQVRHKTLELREKNHTLHQEVGRHRQTQEALMASHQLMERTMNCMQDGLILIDVDSRGIILTNQYALQILGYSEDTFMQTRPEDLFCMETDEADPLTYFLDHTDENRQVRHELMMRRLDRTQFPGEVTMTPFCETASKRLYQVMTFRDITERKSLHQSEMRLRQAQKMEAIGTLAGGIAHDFNNLLTPVMGYTQMIQSECAFQDENMIFYLDQIMSACNRAKSLTKQILAFSRTHETKRETISLLAILQEALQLLRASLPSTIEIRMHVETMCDQVLADPTQIHQVIMNLCTNAAQAMPYGGLLHLALSDEVMTHPTMINGADLSDGEFIRLTVRDTGEGIPSNILHRIFDPFFTTKEQGQGTGMGLSVVHGIVMEYHGAIGVESAPHKGTAFHIYLPKTEVAVESRDEAMRHDQFGQSEHLLVVDDEEMIAHLLKRGLERHGFRVTQCTDSRVALRAFTAEPHAFDLMITDQTMPHQTGLELSEQFLAIRPDLPVVLCTGNDVNISKERILSIGIRKLLIKPQLPSDLAKEIREILNAPNTISKHKVELGV